MYYNENACFNAFLKYTFFDVTYGLKGNLEAPDYIN